MKHLIEANSQTLITKTISSILKQTNTTSENVYYYDYQVEGDLSTAINDYLTESILGDKKIIIVKNFKLDVKKLNKNQKNIIEDFFKINSSNVAVLINDEFDTDSELFKNYSTNFDFHKLSIPAGKDFYSFIDKWAERHGIEFTKESKKLLNTKVDNNFEYLVNELKKIELSGIKNADVLFIDKISHEYKIENVFSFIAAIFNNDIQLLKELFIKYKQQGISIVTILDRLIDDLILIGFVKGHYQYDKDKLDSKQLAKEMNINEFRMKKILENSDKFSTKKITNLIKELLEFKTKTIENNPDEIYDIFYSFLINNIN